MSDQLAETWLKDQTLLSAFRYSTVWFFRELAPKIGAHNFGRFLARFDYGNRDITSGVNGFWLNGSLKISAEEQVTFLTRFYQNQLGISARTRSYLISMMVLEETDQYRIGGKTGSNANGFGWLVGYVETTDNTWLFAFNADLPKDQRGSKHRLRMIRDILRELKVIRQR